MGTHPIFESDFDCLTEMSGRGWFWSRPANPHSLEKLKSLYSTLKKNKQVTNNNKDTGMFFHWFVPQI